MSQYKDFSFLRLDGGNLSLDFINTISDRTEEPLYDHLTSYSDLIVWAEYAGGIDENLKDRLLKIYQKNQEKADQLFQQARELREAMYRYSERLIRKENVHESDNRLINQWLKGAYAKLELKQSGNEIALDWNTEEIGLESVLWPIIRSFVELVTSDQRKRIKECPNCGWLFADQSKNNSRRWCSMEICGNRVKVRRHAKKNLV